MLILRIQNLEIGAVLTVPISSEKEIKQTQNINSDDKESSLNSLFGCTLSIILIPFFSFFTVEDIHQMNTVSNKTMKNLIKKFNI